MTVHSSSNLDTEKLRKVHRLMTGGATDGERSAARARAEAMAAKAGMSLKDALSSLDGRPTPPKSKNIFQDMADAFEEWVPSWKGENDEFKAQRERERAVLRAAAIAEYGSEDALWEETERERLLRETLEPLADWGSYANTGGRYIQGYAGWQGGHPPLVLRQALARAYPFPRDLAGVWQERNEMERRQDLQCAFAPGADMPVWVRARLAALEYMMDTMPDPSFSGMSARLEWLEALNERGYSRGQTVDASLIDALRFDFDTLRKRCQSEESKPSSPPVQNGHRTTAEKRAAVLAMLDTFPELSDREIARRLGVSPQTVNTWRRRR